MKHICVKPIHLDLKSNMTFASEVTSADAAVAREMEKNLRNIRNYPFFVTKIVFGTQSQTAKGRGVLYIIMTIGVKMLMTMI